MVRVPACTGRVALVAAWLVCATAPSADAVSVSPAVAARLARAHSPRVAASEAQLHARGIDTPNSRNPLRLDPAATRVIHGTALVLLLDFPDKPATTTPAHFDSLLFARGWRTGSLRDYYLEVSRGRLDVSEGGVFGWYRMPHDYGWYVDGQRGFGVYPHNAQRLAEDALAAAHDASVNLGDYDNDGPDGVPRSRGSHDDDGLVDGIFLVHAGPGFELTGNYNDIHSHEWGVHTPVVLDGTTAWLYSMEPEDGTVGVFCHEYGHVLGLPDLYDTGDTWGASGVGDWSLMGTGSWIGTIALGDTPVHLDAWSKTQLGFVAADTVRTWRERVRIEPAETPAGQIFRLATPGLPPSEYFLVENRQPLGFDRGIRGPGLVIYHVDESVARNDDPLHYKVAVVQADGLHQLEGKNFPDRGDGGDPFPGASARARFGGDTHPSNAYYRLGPSQVALEIQGEVGFDILARLFSTTSSHLQVRAAEPQWRVTPSGAVTPTRITITLENDGLLAGRITVAVRSLVPGFTTGAVTPAYIDALPTGTSVSVEVALAGDHAPPLVRLEVRTDAGDGATRIDTVQVDLRAGLGAALPPPASDDEAAAAGWSHAALAPGSARDPGAGSDAWRVAADPLADPLADALDEPRADAPAARRVWTSGASDSTTRHYLDAALVTPVFRVAPGAVVRFRQRMDADVFTDHVGWDGGVVDVALDGGAWQRLSPAEGYPYTLQVYGGTALSGQAGFSGHETAWRNVELPLDPVLAGRTASACLRFRFASGRDPVGSGWWIGQVRVSRGVAARLGLTAAPDAGGAGVHLAWTPASEPLVIGRAQSSPGSSMVGRPSMQWVLDTGVAAAGAWTDRTAPPGEQVQYTLASSARMDTVLVDIPLRAARLDVGTAPARGALPVRFSLPAAAAVRLDVFDIRGRLVRRLWDGPAAAGDTRVSWDWRDTASGTPRVSPGVYFLDARLGRGVRIDRKIVLVGE